MNSLLSGELYQKLVAGDSFNIGSVLNDQTNRMIERMYIECNTSGGGGGITIQLPTFAYLQGSLNFEVIISDTGNNAGTNNITILPGSGNTVNQTTSFVINTNKAAVWVTGGSQSDWVCFKSLDASGGVGTVTSFSSGNLSPLFTTSVATATSAPALSFTLSTQVANTIFAGPATGVDAAPTFRALVASDLTGLAGTVTSFSSGNLSPLFTTSVATATTTPALSFVLTDNEVNTVFAGPDSGSPGAPTFRMLVGADLPFTHVTAAATLDATQYLTVTIGVTTYKLALIV